MQILFKVAQFWMSFNKSSLCRGGKFELASPATIHKHIARLRKSDYVTAQPNDKDKRTKHLTLSPLGAEYIDHLSKAILKAAAK